MYLTLSLPKIYVVAIQNVTESEVTRRERAVYRGREAFPKETTSGVITRP